MVLLAPIPGNAEEAANTSFDGLVAVEDSEVHMAYIDPDADFSVFQRVAILDPHFAATGNVTRTGLDRATFARAIWNG